MRGSKHAKKRIKKVKENCLDPLLPFILVLQNNSVNKRVKKAEEPNNSKG